MWYALIRRLERLASYVFFRHVDVLGRSRMPMTGPLVLYANHPNGIIDGVLLMSVSRRPLSFLAKSTLYGIPILGFLMRRAGTIPVYRAKDKADTSLNAASLAAAREQLAAGAAVALFPEGGSAYAPDLMPFKTGAARLALETEAEHGWTAAVQVQAAGLYYESRREFRSRAVIAFGEPRGVTHLRASYEQDPVATVRALTEELEEGLRRHTLAAPDWELLQLAERAGDILAGGQDAEQLGPRLSLGRTALETYERLLAARDDARVPRTRLDTLVSRLRDFDAALRRLGLDDHDLPQHIAQPRRALGANLLLDIASLPIAAAGAVAYWLPYRATGWIARAGHAPPELYATVKLLVGVLAVPLWTALIVALAGWAWSVWAALAALVVLPLLGWRALALRDDLQDLADDWRLSRLARSGSALLAELAAERDAIGAEMRAIGRELERPAAPRI